MKTLFVDSEAIFVSDIDYERSISRKWRTIVDGNTRYALSGHTDNGNQVQMANFIMGDPPSGHFWDHKDHNGLNNQRENLRLATSQQNAANRVNTGKTQSGYKGVARYKRHQKWAARIKVNGRLIFLGFFDKKEDAARCYDQAAIEHFGEFAGLNFPL